MRSLLIIIVLAALGFFGWTYYQSHKEALNASVPILARLDAASNPTPADEPPDPSMPEFVSKVKTPDAPPGVKPMAPPGFFYMTDRIAVETKDGVIAVEPGDLVKLLRRRSDGTLRVTIDLADFEVKDYQVSRDPEVARVAEKQNFEAKYKKKK